MFPHLQSIEQGQSALRAHRIIGQTFCVFIFGDIITTFLAIRNGAHESNTGIHPYINPVFLMSVAPWTWVLLIIGVMVLTLILARSLSAAGKRVPYGLALFIVPLFIEANATLINISYI